MFDIFQLIYHMEKLLFRRLVVPSLKKEALIAIKPGSIYDHLSLEATLTERCIVYPGWSLLLVYISNPHCVVLGRHQNPWIECCVGKLEKDNAEVARRISGGGTVYHDNGNVNFSLISDRTDYDRRKNLGFLVSALKSCGVPANAMTVTDKYDLLLSGQKVSGTAARLDKNTSMHHFTCLVDANLKAINSYLKPSFAPEHVVSSRATPSRVASVANVATPSSSNYCRWSFSNDILINNFINVFFSLPTMTKNGEFDGLSNCESSICDVGEILCNDKMLLSELRKRQAEYRTWDWIFGKTPPFVVRHSFTINGAKWKLEFSIEAGCVINVQIKTLEESFPSTTITECENRLAKYLKNLPLLRSAILTVFSEAKSVHKSELDALIFGNAFSFLLNAC